jgi:hypothetical protein
MIILEINRSVQAFVDLSFHGLYDLLFEDQRQYYSQNNDQSYKDTEYFKDGFYDFLGFHGVWF